MSALLEIGFIFFFQSSPPTPLSLKPSGGSPPPRKPPEPRAARSGRAASSRTDANDSLLPAPDTWASRRFRGAESHVTSLRASPESPGDARTGLAYRNQGNGLSLESWTKVPGRSASLFLLVHLHPSREAGVLWPMKGVFSLTFQGCPLSKSQLRHSGESQNFREKRERNDR